MGLNKKMIMLLLAAVLAVIVAACGSSEGDGSSGSEGPEPATAGAAVEKGIPPALAENRAQANQILDDGSLEAKLQELKGHPIVVNQWASWCEPCRAEFPFFRDSAEEHADKIAFLGIDMQDERGAAEDFLDEIPVSYPSVDDPNAEQITALGGGIVSPTTVYITKSGEIASVFQGGYATREQLEADIDQYLSN